jgi:hypothetical protein
VSESDHPRAYLYDGVGQEWFSARAVADHLGQWLPWLTFERRDDPLAGGLAAIQDEGAREEASTALAESLCRIRVLNPTATVDPWARRLLKPEVEYESRLLRGAVGPAAGVLYDGHELQRLAAGQLPRTERRLDAVHIWFTERSVATWDEADCRYHARVSVYGLPSIVSTAGMVQAPARERPHYLARRLGLDPKGAGAHPPAGFLDYQDPRTTEVAKGYAMQAVFYALSGEPFCADPHCRLFNAHWQQEMLVAQLEGGDYCARHRERLGTWATARTK